MITKPTVLILGAGASMSFGFPSGLGLLKDIHAKLVPSSGNWVDILKNFGITDDFIRTFRYDLVNSSQPSVDAFLERRPEFLEIGKLAITFGLIPHEDEYFLSDLRERENSWYAYLWNKLNTSFDTFQENKLSIITFNYDRSIEHFLFKSMKSTYAKSDSECAAALNSVPIIHVHGSLGSLPWQEGTVHREYQPRIELVRADIKRISEQIVVISEKEDTAPVFDRVFNIMSEAERIYFLGFGYHETNLRRLRVDRVKNKELLGTAYDWGRAEADAINRRWRISLPDTSRKVLEFLRNYAPFE